MTAPPPIPVPGPNQRMRSISSGSTCYGPSGIGPMSTLFWSAVCRTGETGTRRPSADIATSSIPENDLGRVVGERRSTLGRQHIPTPARRTPGAFPGAFESLPPELPVAFPDPLVGSPEREFMAGASLRRDVDSSFGRGAADG